MKNGLAGIALVLAVLPGGNATASDGVDIQGRRVRVYVAPDGGYGPRLDVETPLFRVFVPQDGPLRFSINGGTFGLNDVMPLIQGLRDREPGRRAVPGGQPEAIPLPQVDTGEAVVEEGGIDLPRIDLGTDDPADKPAPEKFEVLPQPARPAVPNRPPEVRRALPQAEPAAEIVRPRAAVPAFTLRQFARSFRPYPGSYVVNIIHPYTNRVCEVRFTLPDLPLREFEVDSNDIEFNYRGYDVEVEFKRDGRVVVDYDD